MAFRGGRLLFVAAAAAGLAASGCGDDPVAAALRPSQPDAAASAGAGAGQSASSSAGGAGGAASVGAGGVGAGGSPGATFGLLAWNLEQFPHSSAASADVAAVIGDLAPAVVAVEEIADIGAFQALAGSLPGYVGAVASQGDGYVRVGMLYDGARVQVSDLETLFPDDWYPFPRAPLKAHVTIIDSGFDFDLLVIHLKAQLDSESEARRRQGCKDLDAWVRAQLSNGGDPDIVLAGDFNDKITDAGAHNVFAPFLDAPDVYGVLTQPVADAGDFSYIPFQSLIDHIVVTSGVLGAYGPGSTEALHLEDTVADYLHDVSDHRPVLAKFAGR